MLCLVLLHSAYSCYLLLGKSKYRQIYKTLYLRNDLNSTAIKKNPEILSGFQENPENLLKILCYKNQGIHWYPCHPTFLWKINFTLEWRLISALIWDISGLWNLSDGRDCREKWIVISRFLAAGVVHEINFSTKAIKNLLF